MNLDKKIIEGKGVFLFTDPAGANSIFAIIDFLISINKVYKKDFIIFTNDRSNFDEKYIDSVERIKFKNKICSNILNKFKPDYIFSATSNNNFEHLWRKFFFKKIKIYSFIDHWGNYLNRFRFNKEICFGDEIWVIDDLAKKEAIEEGIPESILNIKGNPYYEKVKSFSPKISKNNFFKKYKFDINKKVILFISDDIKSNFDIDEFGNCILGYDEFTILKNILDTLKTISIDNEFFAFDYQLIIKIHPKANQNKFDSLIKNYSFMKIFTIKSCNSLSLNYYSDCVLGMFSNMVIESFLMNKKLLRVQIGQLGNDLLKLKEIKDNVVVNEGDLLKKIKIVIN